MRFLSYAALLFLLITTACNEKKQDIVPSLQSEPNSGSHWLYRFTEYDTAGTIVTRENVTYRAFLKTINTKKWVVVENEKGNTVYTLQKREDGYYTLFENNTRDALLYRYPAVANDSYKVYMPDSALHTYKVLSTASGINVPAGTFKNCYLYERYNDSNDKKEEIVFARDRWIIKQVHYEEGKLGRYIKNMYELVEYRIQ